MRRRGGRGSASAPPIGGEGGGEERFGEHTKAFLKKIEYNNVILSSFQQFSDIMTKHSLKQFCYETIIMTLKYYLMQIAALTIEMV